MAMQGEVIIATYNREKELSQCLYHIEQAALKPQRVIIIDATPDYRFDYKGNLNILYKNSSEQGSSVQRNEGIECLLDNTDIVTFLDDDFYVDEDYFANLYSAFERDETLVGAGGALRRDGDFVTQNMPQNDKDVNSLYGCNMSFRVAQIGDTRFDENLKLYAFMEDWDFSYRMAQKGSMKRLWNCTGEHDRAPNKPVDDRKMGYMIVANSCYLKRKNHIYHYSDTLYYLAYICKHMCLWWQRRSRQRFLGAVQGFIKVVIKKESL